MLLDRKYSDCTRRARDGQKKKKTRCRRIRLPAAQKQTAFDYETAGDMTLACMAHAHLAAM